MSVPEVRVSQVLAARDQPASSLNDGTRCVHLDYRELNDDQRAAVFKALFNRFGPSISYNMIDGSGMMLYPPNRPSEDAILAVTHEALERVRLPGGVQLQITQL